MVDEIEDPRSEQDKEIQDVMREERARGKKHLETNEIEKRRRIEKGIIELAQEIDDEEVFSTLVVRLCAATAQNVSPQMKN
jgi:hypothetical protein